MQTPFWHVSPVAGLHLKHCPQVTFTGPWVHVPFWQVSAVQRLPVSHGVLLTTLVCTQPVVGSQVSTVHGLSSSQSTGSPPAHTPAAVHISPVVQAFSSLQGLPTWLASGTQVPVSGSHLKHCPQVTLTGP